MPTSLPNDQDRDQNKRPPRDGQGQTSFSVAPTAHDQTEGTTREMTTEVGDAQANKAVVTHEQQLYNLDEQTTITATEQPDLNSKDVIGHYQNWQQKGTKSLQFTTAGQPHGSTPLQHEATQAHIQQPVDGRSRIALHAHGPSKPNMDARREVEREREREGAYAKIILPDLHIEESERAIPPRRDEDVAPKITEQETYAWSQYADQNEPKEETIDLSGLSTRRIGWGTAAVGATLAGTLATAAGIGIVTSDSATSAAWNIVQSVVV